MAKKPGPEIIRNVKNAYFAKIEKKVRSEFPVCAAYCQRCYLCQCSRETQPDTVTILLPSATPPEIYWASAALPQGVVEVGGLSWRWVDCRGVGRSRGFGQTP